MCSPGCRWCSAGAWRGLSHALFFAHGLALSGFTLSWAAAKGSQRHCLVRHRTALVNTGAFLGAAILQPLAGWVIEQHRLQAGIRVLAGGRPAGTLAALALKETAGRYIGNP